jgi:hypothetical protein
MEEGSWRKGGEVEEGRWRDGGRWEDVGRDEGEGM